jgi:hypothetical protein
VMPPPATSADVVVDDSIIADVKNVVQSAPETKDMTADVKTADVKTADVKTADEKTADVKPKAEPVAEAGQTASD